MVHHNNQNMGFCFRGLRLSTKINLDLLAHDVYVEEPWIRSIMSLKKMMTMMMVIMEMVTVMPHVAHHSLLSLLRASSANMIVDGSSCGSGMLWWVRALFNGLITDPNTLKLDSDTLNLTYTYVAMHFRAVIAYHRVCAYHGSTFFYCGKLWSVGGFWLEPKLWRCCMLLQ